VRNETCGNFVPCIHWLRIHWLRSHSLRSHSLRIHLLRIHLLRTHLLCLNASTSPQPEQRLI